VEATGLTDAVPLSRIQRQEVIVECARLPHLHCPSIHCVLQDRAKQSVDVQLLEINTDPRGHEDPAQPHRRHPRKTRFEWTERAARRPHLLVVHEQPDFSPQLLVGTVTAQGETLGCMSLE
jgi:hypothetical protein